MAVFNRQYILRNEDRSQVIAIINPGRTGVKSIVIQGGKSAGVYKFLYEKGEDSVHFMKLNRADSYSFPGSPYCMYTIQGEWFGVLRGFIGEIVWIRLDDDLMPRRFKRVDGDKSIYQEEE